MSGSYGRIGYRLRDFAFDLVGLGLIAEGIETALVPSIRFEVPVWAALNAGLVAKWQPPGSVRTVVISVTMTRRALARSTPSPWSAVSRLSA